MLSSRKVFAVLGMVLLVHSAASALTINATFTNSAGEIWDATRQTVVNTAIAEWETVFSNVSQTVDVEFDFTNAGTGGYLGQWAGSMNVSYYTQEPTPLRPWDTSTISGFTGADINVSHVVHVNADLLSGANYLWFDPTPSTGDDIPFAAWDALSVMRHEICHMMGFTDFYMDNYFDSGSGNWDNQITVVGPDAIFDAGGLNLTLASTSNTNHFADSGLTADDLMVPALANNERRDISFYDVASLEVAYGYDLVPEPASLSLLGFGAIALLRRRRNG